MWKDLYILSTEELQLVRQQYAESQRRERILVRRLANKEQEMQDYVTQISELKAAQAPGPSALKNALLDPAVNLLFQKLKTELVQTRARLEETQNELSAWKFTPDSNTGKRLMAKCRLLYQENEELGKMTSNGRLAKLEGDLALQKNISEELKKTQLDLDEVLMELEEDLEGMQNTIVLMQRELQGANEKIASLERENGELRRSLGGEHVNGCGEMDVNCGSSSARTARNVENVCLNNGEMANCNDARTSTVVCDGRVMGEPNGGCSVAGGGPVEPMAVDGENACSKSNKRTYDESDSSEFSTCSKRRASLVNQQQQQTPDEEDESIKVQNFTALTQNGTLSKT
ncbi:pre-mRNA-splicing regulator female-lethal(2)D isoform X2 [Phlebotomus papatasi]|uniref:pre-mRNA-splicing regulator female-lethal(2)D isoform X2 n=1 Tax=Phlebotomus papatasi TaxID=29031 RepID=UPI0024840B6B|nr:pre-mRNA-splicing regulator female-lethal(2)D isoform X2 [Phlebotomus papatasi]